MARTEVKLHIQPSIGSGVSGFEGTVAKTDLFAVTDDEATTAIVYMGGLLPWKVHNETGDAITLSMYDAGAVDGAALTSYDVDDVAFASVTMADGTSYDISDLAGCLYVIVVGSVAASGLRMIARR